MCWWQQRGAGRYVPAERLGPTGLDRRHHLELAEADMPGIGPPPCGPMGPEDVSDLQPRAGQRPRPSLQASLNGLVLQLPRPADHQQAVMEVQPVDLEHQKIMLIGRCPKRHPRRRPRICGCSGRLPRPGQAGRCRPITCAIRPSHRAIWSRSRPARCGPRTTSILSGRRGRSATRASPSRGMSCWGCCLRFADGRAARARSPRPVHDTGGTSQRHGRGAVVALRQVAATAGRAPS